MGAELRGHLLSLRFRGRLRSLGLRHWVLISAYGREEEVQEREARDDRGREERRPQTDEVADDSGGKGGRWRDREPDESRRGAHSAQEMLRRQGLHEARGPDDPEWHRESKERLREAEHRRGLHRSPPGERKQETAQRFEEERGDHHRPDTPSRRERPRERGPEKAERTDHGERDAEQRRRQTELARRVHDEDSLHREPLDVRE